MADLPTRYEVVRWGDDGSEEVLARAVDAEGLFADEVRSERELFVFRGCPPAVAASFDEVFGFEVRDDAGMTQWWALVDLSVHAVSPEGDVFVTASHCCFPEGREPLSGTVQYVLRSYGPEGRCASIDGFPRADGRPDTWLPVTLIGCEPAERMREVLTSPDRWKCYLQEDLRALNVNGEEIASVPFSLEVITAKPSPLGEGLFDITFDQSALDNRTFPKAGGRPVWERWRAGAPTEPNLWARYDTAGRAAWRDLTLVREDRPEGWTGGVFHLDGRYVTDRPSMYLALGEALLGPGRTFGRNYNEVADHLYLSCCGRPPENITLVWHDADVAHNAVGREFVELAERLSHDLNLVLEPSLLDGE